MELNGPCNPSFYKGGDKGPEQLGHLLRNTEQQYPAQCSSQPAIKIDSGSPSNAPGPHSGWCPSCVISVPPLLLWRNGTKMPVTVLQPQCLRATCAGLGGQVGQGAGGQGWSPHRSPVTTCQVQGQKQGLLGAQVGGTCRRLLCTEQEKAREGGSEGEEIHWDLCPWQRGSFFFFLQFSYSF